MGKKWIVKIFMPAVLLVSFSTAARAALPVGTKLSFSDFVSVNETISSSGMTSVSYAHVLDPADFWPILQGGEQIDITAGGQVVFEMMANPITSMTVRASLNGIFLGDQSFTKKNFFKVWQFDLPEAAYKSLEDRKGIYKFELIDGQGSLFVANSVIGGAGIVVPEPASLTLLLGGLLTITGVRAKKKSL